MDRKDGRGDKKTQRAKIMIRITKTTLIATLFFLLAGCSSMNSKFDCPNKPGVTCKSIDQVNAMVDRGMIGGEQSIAKIKNEKPPYLAQKEANLSGRFNKLRVGEQVVRVWVAPYQDSNNNYHNESTLYTVVRKNNWVVPKEISE